MGIRWSSSWKRAATAALLAASAAPAQDSGGGVTRIPQPSTHTRIPFAKTDAAAVATPSAPEAWGGVRSGAESTLSDRVASYRIEARLDPVKHSIDGRQILTWRNRGKNDVRVLYLHLYMNAFESCASTFFTE